MNTPLDVRGRSRVFNALVAYEEETEALRLAGIRRPAPTYRDLCQLTGLSSPSTVLNHLRNLKREGKVDWTPGLQRTVYVVFRPQSKAS